MSLHMRVDKFGKAACKFGHSYLDSCLVRGYLVSRGSCASLHSLGHPLIWDIYKACAVEWQVTCLPGFIDSVVKISTEHMEEFEHPRQRRLWSFWISLQGFDHCYKGKKNSVGVEKNSAWVEFSSCGQCKWDTGAWVSGWGEVLTWGVTQVVVRNICVTLL